MGGLGLSKGPPYPTSCQGLLRELPGSIRPCHGCGAIFFFPPSCIFHFTSEN